MQKRLVESGARRSGRRRVARLLRALLLLALVTPITVGATTWDESGLPPLRSFSPKEYRGGTQNWDIAQDPRGLIYVANNDGVLEFDGQRWQRIPISNQNAIRSLAVDGAGRVYVGAIGDFGYLQPQAQGAPRFVSLLPRLPASARDFSDVWHTLVSGDQVVFVSYQGLFRLRGDVIDHFRPEQAFHRAFLADGQIIVRDSGRGLLRLAGNQLQLLDDGQRFRDHRVYAVLGLPPSAAGAAPEWLVGERDHGLWRSVDGTFRRWPSAVDPMLTRGLLYTALALPDGRFALGTLQDGLHLVDASGRRVGHLDRSAGLLDPGVLALFQDREQGLWLGLDRGLARVEIQSPLTAFDERNGLQGEVFSVQRHAGRLYVGTSRGLFRLQPGVPAHFQRVDGIDGQTWAMLSQGETLLIANYQGLYRLQSERATALLAIDQAFSLLASRRDPGRLYIGWREGLRALRRDGERWRDEGPVAGVSDEVRSLAEQADGSLWLGTRTTGLLRRPALPDGEPGAFERFGIEHGLPSLIGNGVYAIGQEILFSSEAGILRFDSAHNRFEPDPRFAPLFAQASSGLSSLSGDLGQELVLYARDPRSGISRPAIVQLQADDGWTWRTGALDRLAGVGTPAMNRTLREPDGVVWVGNADGLFRLEPDRSGNSPATSAPRALLRRVVVGDGTVAKEIAELDPGLRLDHSDQRLRFEFAAPSFDGERPLQFQVRLVGNDEAWSAWSDEAYADYSNLWEGDYRFQVRARHAHGEAGPAAYLALSIDPPWYRSLWAYLAYLLALLGLGWSALRWRLLRLREQKRALEQQVRERTADLFKLGEIGRELTATLDLEQAFSRIHHQIAARLDAHVFLIAILQESQQTLYGAYVVEGGRREPSVGFDMADTERPAAWCVRSGQPLITNERAELAGYLGRIALPKTGEAMESVVYLPLRVGSRIIGCLSVQSPRKHAYSPSQLEMLRVLASYTAIALDNSQAYRQLQSALDDLRESKAQIEQMSLTDPLTGLHNRRFLQQRLDDDVSLSLRQFQNWISNPGAAAPEKADLIFFLVDLDHFKLVNDTLGHAAGDQVLVQMRQRLEQVFRTSDYLIRWGGEEFLVVARHTRREHAAELAERLRQTVAQRPFTIEGSRALAKTCSIGFACFPFAVDEPTRYDWQQVVDIADRCLYAAKHGGRNRWVGALHTTIEGSALSAEELVERFLGDEGLALLLRSPPQD